MLSERISTCRPIRSGRKNWQARQTASISKQLMWKPLSAFDQWPKVGLPSHSAPQPVFEASVVTTFLVWTNPMATPFFIHCGFFQGFTLICKRPWRHALCGTRGFNQRWRGRMRSRPSCNTGDAAAIRPSILWNTLSGRAVSLLKVAVSFWMARARSGAITALMWTESRTVPRNDTRSLVSLLAKLTLSPRRSKWLRMRVLCESSSTSDWARMGQTQNENCSLFENVCVLFFPLSQRTVAWSLVWTL